jgi:hypothetical protein
MQCLRTGVPPGAAGQRPGLVPRALRTPGNASGGRGRAERPHRGAGTATRVLAESPAAVAGPSGARLGHEGAYDAVALAAATAGRIWGHPSIWGPTPRAHGPRLMPRRPPGNRAAPLAPAAAAGASAAAAAAADAEFEAFAAAAAGGANVVPLFRRLLSDQLTPVLAYRCLVKENDVAAPSFLLESVVNGDQQGRYSFVGAMPALEVVAKGSRVTVLNHEAGTRRVTDEADPMDVSGAAGCVCWLGGQRRRQRRSGRGARDTPQPLVAGRGAHARPIRPPPPPAPQVPVQLSRNWRPAQVEGLPAVFTGGWVGYAGYDTVRYVYAGAAQAGELASGAVGRRTGGCRRSGQGAAAGR